MSGNERDFAKIAAIPPIYPILYILLIHENFPPDVIARVAKAGFRLPTFMRLRRYLDDTTRQGNVPEPESIVLDLLPWAGKDRYRAFLRWDLPAPAR